MNKGQSLIDALIGLALLALGIGFGAILVFGGQSVLVDRENALRARALAREGVNGATLLVKNNWNGTADGTYGLVFINGQWQFSGSEDQSEIFKRRITITTTADNQREIKSVVSWEAGPLRPLSVELVTLATNWKITIETGGDTGGSGTAGDWQHPRTLGSVDLGPGNEATDLDVKQKIVYLSAEASDAKKPDFFVVDAANGQSPTIIASLNTGSGLNSIDVAGSYAYVANKATNAQLQIIDITNPSGPALVTSFGLPSNNTRGITVFYSSGKVYVGTEKANGAEFHVIDVSNPLAPSALGIYEIGDKVNDIYVSGNLAYLATEAGTNGLLILDVSNPAAVTRLGGIYSDDAYAVFNQTAARTFLGTETEFRILDTSNPASPTTLGTLASGGKVNDLYVRDTLAFVGTSNNNREFQIVDVSNPAAPALYSYYNFPQVATGIDYEDNLVYVSVRSNDALRIITSSP